VASYFKEHTCLKNCNIEESKYQVLGVMGTRVTPALERLQKRIRSLRPAQLHNENPPQNRT
jgi:hypothetical protein